MTNVARWRKRMRLTQAEAGEMLGVSQTYLSLLEHGERPVTSALRGRMALVARTSARDGKAGESRDSDSEFRAGLSALGYPGFTHVARRRTTPRPDDVLIEVLSTPDADARVVEALPWILSTFEDRLDFAWLTRQAKLRDLQNRLGFLIQAAAVNCPEARAAAAELEKARLLREDTLCWESMPDATRDWMRAHRSPLAAHWNVLTRLRDEDLPHVA